MDFDEGKVKMFSNCVDIDSSFIRNAETDTLIVASNSIEIAGDFTDEIDLQSSLQSLFERDRKNRKAKASRV